MSCPQISLESALQETQSRTIWKHLVHLSMCLFIVSPSIIEYKLHVVRDHACLGHCCIC